MKFFENHFKKGLPIEYGFIIKIHVYINLRERKVGLKHTRNWDMVVKCKEKDALTK